MESIRQRINEVFELTHLNPNNVSDGDRNIQNRLNRQIKGTTAITVDSIVFILGKIPNLNLEWLFTGKGDMFLSPYPTVPTIIGQNTIGNSNQVTYNNGNNDPDGCSPYEIVELPIIPGPILKAPETDLIEWAENNKTEVLPVVAETACADIIVRVKDMSMSPEFQMGDVLFLKALPKKEITNGNIYVVDRENEGTILRMVYNQDKDNLLLKAHNNQRYTDVTLPLSEVKRIYTITQMRRVSF